MNTTKSPATARALGGMAERHGITAADPVATVTSAEATEV